MRWQQLFADLSAQYEEAAEAAERAELASRTRAEIGRVELADRLRGAVGGPVALRCLGAGRVGGTLLEVGPDWLLLDDDRGREVLVPAAAVISVAGLGRTTAAPEEGGAVHAALDLRRALRGLARDRSAVGVTLVDGGILHGTVDRVGADFFEIAEHAADLPRRTSAVRAVHAVPLPALGVVVRSAGPSPA